MTDSVIRSWMTRIEDYHTVYIMPNAKCEMPSLLPMIKNTLTLAFSTGQGGVIQNFNFSTH